MSRALPGLGLIGYWGTGFNGWNLDAGMDGNLRKLSALCQASIISFIDFADLPASPDDGEIYIQNDDDEADHIVIRDNGEWVYIVPTDGTLVFNQDDGAYWYWDGLTWALAETTFGLFLAKALNLSDLANAATARTNLGLGTVAVLDSDTDTALTANSDLRIATQKAVKAYADAISAGAGSTYLAKASNLSDLANAATARTNLGLDTAATHPATDFAQVTNNLSDLANAATARSNLGLGSIATQAANNVSITGGSITGITDLAVADGGTGSSTASAARTALGLAYGTDVVAPASTSTFTAGQKATAFNQGTVTSGTYKPAVADGNLQYYVNGGAHTFAAPDVAGDYTIAVQMTNNGSAGTPTVSGFTKQTGDALTTTNGDDFMLYITKVNGFVHLNVVALQ